MEKKGNNKGFSLLELLVAVAILAVIVTPFLMAFLTTTRINASTKEAQRAKFAATNVMEDIRSRDVDSVIANSVKQDDGTYLYTTTQVSDGVDYTVEAILDPRRTTTKENSPDPESDADEDEATDYNAEKMANIYGMSSAYDGFYELDATTDNSKVEQLAEILLGNRDKETLQNVYDSVNREIVLTISNNDKGGTDVKVRSIYTMPSGARINTVSTQDQIIYTDTTGEIDLRGIYLFYNPLYNGTKRQARETITVVNEKGNKCIVYLCKQEWPSTTGTDADKSFPFFEYCHYNDKNTRNANYLVNVRLKEPNRADSEIPLGDNPDVVTSIRTNIDDLSDISKLEQYQTMSSTKVLNARLNLTYTNHGDNYSYEKNINGTTYPAGQLMGIRDLSGVEVRDHVFKVTVNAYKGIGDSRESEASGTVTSTTQ
ncbi:MAG: prepilin-type N-terminal cleavage/methylation domain-containing protein [Lachnospiraceae bacterium]|nr:prepilin-type N-terminal cleavage/methylation domain-containing protein [Lachnospiraceae bacterium]